MKITIVWKKLVSAVFCVAAGGLAALAWLFHHATPRSRPAARHAAPDDGQDWADALRAIASPLRKRKVPPAAVARARVQAVQSVLGQRGCRMELCKYWPGEGCMRGVMPCDDDGHVPPWADGVPAADVDQYLTEHAQQHAAGVPWDLYLSELYPGRFDQDQPVLAGELAPVPWLQPTLPPLPEPVADWRPHACGDVDQPTAILRPGVDVVRAHEDAVLAMVAAHVCHICHESWDNPTSDCACTRGPEDVPGPADSAPSPAGSAEAATPPAAEAGPGTPDDTVTDMAAVADQAFVADVAGRPLDWAAWLDLCLHGDLDTVKAVTHG